MAHSEHITVRAQGVDLALVGDLWHRNVDTPSRGSVLLLHGGGQTRHSWKESARSFADHEWTALAMDARGHGGSGWAPHRDYSVDSMIADIKAAASQLDTPLVLIGASMGGLCSLIAQSEDPDLASACLGRRNGDDKPLADRVAIVTGAGIGLGKTHALHLARAGASVVVNDLPSARMPRKRRSPRSPPRAASPPQHSYRRSTSTQLKSWWNVPWRSSAH